ncbi:MAG: hypothetical protein ABIG89_04240 [Candidatus Woesearchaeota archaeon]
MKQNSSKPDLVFLHDRFMPPGQESYIGFYPPEGWVEFHGKIDLGEEDSLVNDYDKDISVVDVASDSSDQLINIALKHDYVVHDCNKPKSLDDICVYFLGFSQTDFDGENLRQLFKDLADIRALNSNIRVAHHSIIGERSLWEAKLSDEYYIIGAIKTYCLSAGVIIVDGCEHPAVIGKLSKLINRVNEIKKEAAGELSCDERRELIAIKTECYKIFYERAINTYIPLVRDFLDNRKKDEKLICLWEPYYFRRFAADFRALFDGRQEGYANLILPRDKVIPLAKPSQRKPLYAFRQPKDYAPVTSLFPSTPHKK